MDKKNCVVRGRPTKDSPDMYIKVLNDNLHCFVEDIEEATLFTGEEATNIRKNSYMWQGLVVEKETGKLV